MGNSNGKCEEVKSSNMETFSFKMHSHHRRKIFDSCKEEPVFYIKTEMKKKDANANFSWKMTLNPNVKEFPTKDSKNIKYDRSLLTQVIHLILIMIGCILLKIDHKPRVREIFKDAFSDRSLEILRSDLENLLCFESKSSVTWLIMDLMNSQAAGELIWSEDLNYNDPKKLNLRRTLISVVNFMIFRRSKQKIVSKSKIRRSVSILQAKNKFENGESLSLNDPKSNPKIRFFVDCLGSLRNVKRCIGICRNLFSTINYFHKYFTDLEKDDNTTETSFNMDLSQGQLNIYGDDFYHCALSSTSHSCKKIYCPVCFGWLWIPSYYFISIVVFPLLRSLICRFTNAICCLP